MFIFVSGFTAFVFIFKRRSRKTLRDFSTVSVCFHPNTQWTKRFGGSCSGFLFFCQITILGFLDYYYCTYFFKRDTIITCLFLGKCNIPVYEKHLPAMKQNVLGREIKYYGRSGPTDSFGKKISDLQCFILSKKRF